MDRQDYSDNFVNQLNRLYQLSQSNSDLIALHNDAYKKLYTDYPITKELERLSSTLFDFLYNEVFETIDEFEEPINYKGFEDIQTNIPEYWFKNDISILWDTYYLLKNIADAQVKQHVIDIDNRKELLPQEVTIQYIREQKKNLIEQITSLSRELCDRNFVFSYLQGNEQIEKEYLIGYILSELLEKVNSDEYAQYIELDYSKYPMNYNWQLEKKSLKNYPDLSALPHFVHLVNLLAGIFLVKELENYCNEEIIVKEEINNPSPEKKKTTKDIPVEYILSVPILDLIYQEFNDELWNDISLVEFLDMFTTATNRQENFKLKPKQTVRFYYLLKKIWINSDNKSLFNAEKEWIIPFLQNYQLSYSAYTNQFIRNEGGVKHRNFIRYVDKILPKEEIS
ncbi:MAG: hypothetical protein LBV43_08545 [Prevotella sp.]|nr:hypothetical protein [Prevotella sp.]